MAAEGVGFKPGDLYIGVVELFAILLPGAILTYLVWRLHLQYLIEHSAAPLHNLAPGEGAAGYFTFAVLSYVVGHFLAALGWIFMDPVFEAQRTARLFPLLPILEGRVRARTVVQQSANLTESDDLFPWALAYIDTHYPAAAGKLEAIEADCKFFRNLIPTLLLSLPIIDVTCFGWFSGTIETIWIFCFFGYVAIASFFFRRQRHRDFCKGITSLRWLLVLLSIPVITNIVLAWHLQKPRRYFLIDLGILLTALLAIGRYMLLQSKRMATAYDYLLAVLDPIPKSR